MKVHTGDGNGILFGLRVGIDPVFNNVRMNSYESAHKRNILDDPHLSHQAPYTSRRPKLMHKDKVIQKLFNIKATIDL